jgi:hypothetical protein
VEHTPLTKAKGFTLSTTHSLSGTALMPRHPPDTAPFRVHNGILGRGMLYASETPSTPSVEVRKALMEFRIGDTAAPKLSALQRVQLLGQ